MENERIPWTVALLRSSKAMRAEEEQRFGPDVAEFEEFHPRWDPVEKRIQPYDAVEQPPA